MSIYSRFTKVFALAVGVLLIICALLYAVGFRLNITNSIPKGVYITSSKSFAVGDYVMFCPPSEEVFVEARKRGYLSPGQCDGNFSQMMKKILAAKNDRVSVTKNGVYINSKLIPFSKPIAKDGTNRPLPVFRIEDYQLKDDELLLMGQDNPISWDGRYYGLVKETQIKTVIDPVYIY